jgi:hypothetical protein
MGGNVTEDASEERQRQTTRAGVRGVCPLYCSIVYSIVGKLVSGTKLVVCMRHRCLRIGEASERERSGGEERLWNPGAICPSPYIYI